MSYIDVPARILYFWSQTRYRCTTEFYYILIRYGTSLFKGTVLWDFWHLFIKKLYLGFTKYFVFCRDIRKICVRALIDYADTVSLSLITRKPCSRSHWLCRHKSANLLTSQTRCWRSHWLCGQSVSIVNNYAVTVSINLMTMGTLYGRLLIDFKGAIKWKKYLCVFTYPTAII